LSALLCCTLGMPAPFGYAQAAPAADNPPSHAAHRPAYHSAQLEGNERILQALNRFTFGPRPGDVEAVQAMGLDAWFDHQLHPGSIDETELTARLAQFPAMQWSTRDLIYRIPSNAVIRQALNNKGTIPPNGTLHAVYENQMYRLQEKKADQAEKKQDAQNPAQAQIAANAPAPAANGNAAMTGGNGAAMNATTRNGGGMNAGAANADSTAAILDRLDQMSSPAVSAPATQTAAQPQAAQMAANVKPDIAKPGIDAQAQDNFMRWAALVEELHGLPPQQRVARLQSMQPEDFDDFMKSLKQPQRQALTADMTPALREATEDLENPQQLLTQELMAQRLARDVYSNAQLQEVMTDFWLNHFNIYLRKDEQMPYYLVSFERDVIRPHALGKFEDLLEAVAHSPAMMLYLDNSESMGPDSPAAERAKMAAARNPNNKKADAGLNENYARELMELHTLGVNGGYTQADVTQVARVLTGWTVDEPQRGGDFIFNENRHEPGAKKVLGKKIKDNGEREGEELMHMLVTRPATAQFLSRKLALRFVGDDPPQALVDRMAATYMQSHGDIAAMLKTLLHSPEFWDASDYRAKVKTPIEFVVSAARASNANIDNYQPLVNALRQMGMPLYLCVPPTGYKWDAADWVSTGALVDRMNFALNLAANRLQGVTIAWTSSTQTAALESDSDVPSPQTEEARLEPLVVAGGVSEATRAAALEQFQVQSAQDAAAAHPVAAAAKPFNRNRATTALERQDQILAGLLIGSPEFQRR
jgi:uncharacterized protein (DUF1800 family)